MSQVFDCIVKKRDGKLLYRAITSGSLDTVKQLLSSGVDPSSSHGPEPPLHTSIKCGHYQIAKELLKAGVDINTKDSSGRTALFLTVEHELIEFFSLIIASGGDVNVTDSYGYSPLHVAVQFPQSELFMKYLLEHGAFIDAKTHDGNTPLHIALKAHSLRRVKIVLEFQPNIDLKEYQNVFDVAMMRYSSSLSMIVNELITYGFSVAEEKVRDEMLLCKAVVYNLYSLVRHLLMRGANPDSRYQGFYAMELACKYGFLEMLKLLLQYGGWSKYSSATIDTAVMLNHHEMVIELLKSGVRKRPSLIFHALMSDATKVFETLLKYTLPCFNVNSSFGEVTLSHIAVGRDNSKAVEVLWRFGADFNLSKYGYTSLHNACRRGYYQSIEKILHYGGDVNLKDLEGQTAAEILEGRHDHNVKLIRRHIMILYAADIYLCKENLSFMRKDCKEEILSELFNEVESLKKTMVANSDISFYKLLKSSETEVASYVNNEDIYTLLKSQEYKKEFKNYFPLLNSKFVIGSRRKTLIDCFIENIVLRNEFLNNLPALCLHYILSFLSTEEIGIMAGQIHRRVRVPDCKLFYDTIHTIRKKVIRL